MPLNNFGVVDSLVWRSAQPDEQGIIDLSRLGCKTILKLNAETQEEAGWCEKYGISLIEQPIPTFSNKAETIQALASMLDHISRQSNNPVLVHCEHGRDRTGLLIAAYRIMFQNYDVQQADSERKTYGVTGFIALADIDMEVILTQIYKTIHQ